MAEKLKKENPQKVPKTPMQTAESSIKLAAGLAFFSAGLTALMTILSITGVLGFLNINVFALIEVIVVALLAFGVLKKSRVCAVLLLISFGLDKLIIFLDNSATASSMIVSVIILGGAYLGGVKGTFQYHKLKNAEPPEAVEAETLQQ